METLWTFKTRNFAVKLACEDERDPDLSWADQETLDKLDSGEWVNLCFRVTVEHEGRVIGSDYLGNSIYADPRDFASEHRDPDPSNRNCSSHPERRICHYFPGMISEAISEARQTLAAIRALPVHA